MKLKKEWKELLDNKDMNELVKRCAENCIQDECRLSHSLKGWGCKLLTCLPDEVPVSLHDKAMLFAKVYSYAKNSGVTSCKFFRETSIDDALDNEEMLSQMVLLNQPLRTDLLSENLMEMYN